MPTDDAPNPSDSHYENLRLELRRGALVLAVLARLRTEHYGYALRKALADQGMEIDENTLYPLLRRLETQGLLDSEWREEDSDRSASTGSRPRGTRSWLDCSSSGPTSMPALRRITTEDRA